MSANPTALANKAPLLDQTATALMIGLLNPRTLCEWRRRRCGPPYRKLGKRLVRYDQAEVAAWMQRKEA